jgi:hypothetical protein
MAINSLYTAQQLPKTSADAIRVFDERYLAALSAAPPPMWATEFGDVIDSESPDITFPFGHLTTKYRQTDGNGRSKSMLEDSIRVKVVEFDDGYEGRLIDITKNVFAYKQWAAVPQRFITAEARFRNLQIAALLAAGHTTASYDGKNFFDTGHPANPAVAGSSTFDNYQGSAKSVLSTDDIAGEMTSMRGVLDENGDKLGIEPDTIFAQTTKFQGIVNLFKQDIIASSAGTATIRNPYYNAANSKQKGLLQVVHIPEWTDANSGKDWMLVDSEKLAEMPAFASVRYIVPETLSLRYWDEASDFFKGSGKIKVESHIWYGFTLLFPHAFRYVVGS